MIKFKKFLNERTAKEIANDILKIEDINILNKVDAAISSPLIAQLIEKLLNGKQFPSKAKKGIENIFSSDSSSIEEKLLLLKALNNGMITKLPSSGSNITIKSLIDSKYSSIADSSLFRNFCEIVGNFKDSKDSQGSTGTGAGEILLSVLVKDGHLPTSKGDINIFGKGMEVKSSNGRIAAFESLDEEDISDIITKYIKDDIKIPDNLGNLLMLLGNYDEVTASKVLSEFFRKGSTKKTYIKEIENCIKEYNTKKLNKKELQNIFGKNFIKLYQKTDKWDGIILFKTSSNFLEGDISIAYNSSDFEKYINYSGLGMRNGNQNVYLIAKAI